MQFKIIAVKIHNNTTLTIEIFTKSSGIYPLKEFLFVSDKKNKLFLIEDIERRKRILEEEIKEISREGF